MSDKGGAAFPVSNGAPHSGMTLRDYFAAKAMAAIRSNEDEMKEMRTIASEHRVDVTVVVAQYADAQAIAMLKEREGATDEG